jgi:hypothetical protein
MTTYQQYRRSGRGSSRWCHWAHVKISRSRVEPKIPSQASPQSLNDRAQTSRLEGSGPCGLSIGRCWATAIAPPAGTRQDWSGFLSWPMTTLMRRGPWGLPFTLDHGPLSTGMEGQLADTQVRWRGNCQHHLSTTLHLGQVWFYQPNSTPPFTFPFPSGRQSSFSGLPICNFTPCLFRHLASPKFDTTLIMDRIKEVSRRISKPLLIDETRVPPSILPRHQHHGPARPWCHEPCGRRAPHPAATMTLRAWLNKGNS